jgi:hypothetical protein
MNINKKTTIMENELADNTCYKTIKGFDLTIT